MSFYLDNNVPWKEKEKIRHEINTLYSKYDGLRVIAHRSLGLDGRYYVYYIANYGFDNYNIIARVENPD